MHASHVAHLINLHSVTVQPWGTFVSDWPPEISLMATLHLPCGLVAFNSIHYVLYIPGKQLLWGFSWFHAGH